VSPQQAEDCSATKLPRLEEPFSASTDDGETNISSYEPTAVIFLLLLITQMQMQFS
jgi:hypothetical protein